MPGNSWLHIRTDWVSLSSSTVRATLVSYRRDRLPWYQEKFIMAAVIDSDLLLLKTQLTKIQEIKTIDLCDEIVRIKSADMCAMRIDEFASWPAGEAIYEGYIRKDFMTSFRLESPLSAALLQNYRKNPVVGWQPVNRGALGLSFLYNCCNGLGCLELTANTLYYRHGTVVDNAGLYERAIVRSWDINDFDIDAISSLTGNVEDAIQARVMARRMRNDAWVWLVHNELPF